MSAYYGKSVERRNTSRTRRAAVFSVIMMAVGSVGASAQTAGDAGSTAGAASGGAPGAACAALGSPNVFVEGRPMLRLSDVVGCPDLNYEIVPNVFVNGEPAVRLTPSTECAGSGASSVFADGGAVARSGDDACR